MGNNNHNEIKSRMVLLMMHLLKWQFQPERRQTGHSWEDTVNEQRRKIFRLLKKYPSLKNKLYDKDCLESCWNKAVSDAVQETNLPKSTFPPYPIWTTEEILNQDFFPLSAQEREEQNRANSRKSPCADDDFSIGY